MVNNRMGSWGLFALVFVAGVGLGRISIEEPSEMEPLIVERQVQTIPESSRAVPQDSVIAKGDEPEVRERRDVITNKDVLLLARSLTGFERLQLRLAFKNTDELNDRFQLFTSGRMSSTELTEDFQTDFELGEDELRKLQTLFRSVNDEFQDLEASLARGSWTKVGSEWVFDIPTFPESGGVLYDRISAGLESVIGSEKMKVFHETYGAQFERKFGQIGTRERTLTISIQGAASPGGIRLFEIVDQNLTVNGHSSSTSRLQEARFREFLGPLVEKLPPGFFDHNPED